VVAQRTQLGDVPAADGGGPVPHPMLYGARRLVRSKRARWRVSRAAAPGRPRFLSGNYRAPPAEGLRVEMPEGLVLGPAGNSGYGVRGAG
jgi:hypothetical protein